MIDLSTHRLPRQGAIVEVTTTNERITGELVGVIPGRDRGRSVRDREPKLALKGEAWGAAIPQLDIRGVRTVRRAPRRPAR